MPKSGFTQTFEVGSQKAVYAQVTNLSSAVPLPKATSGRKALIQALTQNVRWRADGVNPTSTVGMQLAAGKSFEFAGDLTKLRFIEEAVSAELNVTVFR